MPVWVTKINKLGNLVDSVVNFFLPKFLFPDAASEKSLDGSSSTDNDNPPSESEEYVSWLSWFGIQWLKFLRLCYISSL